jgi:hypothetical protein
MNQDNYRGIRVSLQGTLTALSVGTSSTIYILHARDGRGLRVHPSKDTVIHEGYVQVLGTLRFDSVDTPSLWMNKTDAMEFMLNAPDTTPREFIPQEDRNVEDTWSLMFDKNRSQVIVDGRERSKYNLIPV